MGREQYTTHVRFNRGPTQRRTRKVRKFKRIPTNTMLKSRKNSQLTPHSRFITTLGLLPSSRPMTLSRLTSRIRTKPSTSFKSHYNTVTPKLRSKTSQKIARMINRLVRQQGTTSTR